MKKKSKIVPKTKRPIFDCHIHIHFDFQRSQEYAKKIGINFSPEGLINDMKKYNVVKALIMSTFSNRFTLEFAEKYSPHFLCAATLNPLAFDKKDFEFVKANLANKSFSAIKLYPGYVKFYPYEKKCERIYKLAMKYDVPVIFHSGDPAFESAPVKYCHPIHLDDTACKFPDLKIVISHLGFPWFADTMEVVLKNPNVYTDISGLFSGEKSPYKEKMKEELRREIEKIIYFGAGDKVLFGTDYSLVSYDEYINFAEKLKISKTDIDKLFYGNGERLYKF
ncbi:MAG: amidohydrolase [Candidatus Schekmanbacteria bacterium]|nr:MAG: amidohydrolase [Candidatus Schekmanbacteria bacterium]